MIALVMVYAGALSGFSIQDCEVEGINPALDCWHPWPMLTTSELADYGYTLMSASSLSVSAEAEVQQGQRAFYEISYWRLNRLTFQCRSIFRDDGMALRMTASNCRSPQEVPEISNLWSMVRTGNEP